MAHSNSSGNPSLFISKDLLNDRQRKLSLQSKSAYSRSQALELSKKESSPEHRQISQRKMSQILQLNKKNKSQEHLNAGMIFSNQDDPNSPIRKLTKINKGSQQNKFLYNQRNANQLQQKRKRPTPIIAKHYQDQQNQQYANYGTNSNQTLNWHSIWLYIKLILFSYEFNLLQYLKDIDQSVTQQTIQLLKIAPGYKPIQYIYTFYLIKYGMVTGIIATLLYPLPYSIAFLMITADLQIPFVAIFMFAGMRSGAVALLLKYCLHFPKHMFHWIVLSFTVLIGLFMPNNYIYLMLFGISIFLSFYAHSTSNRSSRDSQSQQIRQRSPDDSPNGLIASTLGLNFNEYQIYKEYKVMDKLPQTYGGLSIFIICVTVVSLWVLQHYIKNRQIQIFGQVMPISLLMSSKQMLVFFPYIYKQWIGKSTLGVNTLISLSFLFPGPHSKAFMFFIIHTQIQNAMIGYTCLYLSPILLVNIYIAYRHHFFTRTYYNIRQSIQCVGNGLVFCLVFQMLSNQPCFFNSICYSAVVIMVVAKLYKLRQLFAITLGIFLISARTIILNINKNISFQQQACLDINATSSSFTNVTF